MIQMTQREFVRLVRRAYASVPAETRRSLENVDVTVEDWPGPEDAELLEGNSSLYGIFTGLPLTERDGLESLLPDRIVIYRQPILRNAKTRAEAEREVRITLWHEIGHCLGLSEDDLHRLGYG